MLLVSQLKTTSVSFPDSLLKNGGPFSVLRYLREKKLFFSVRIQSLRARKFKYIK